MTRSGSEASSARSARSLRSSHLARDMAEICPDAWLFNYTNPMAALCWAVYEGTPHQKIVGVCMSPDNTAEQLAELIGVPFEELTYLVAGMNHQSWVLRLESEGQDLYPRLRAAPRRRPGRPRSPRPHGDLQAARVLPVGVERAQRRPRALVPPARGDGGALPRHRRRVRPAERAEPRDLRRGQAEARRGRAARDRAVARSTRPRSSTRSRRERSGRSTGTSGTRASSRTSRRAAAWRCPAWSTARACIPCGSERFRRSSPRSTATTPNVCELTVRAALEGSREHVYHAAMVDPNTAATLTLEQIHAVCDDLIEAHGAEMPEGIRS